MCTTLSVSVFHNIPIKLRIVPSRCIVASGCVTIAQKGAMGTLLVDVEKRADSISSSNSGSMPESSMLSFSLIGNNRRSILKPRRRFSKGVVMSSGIAGTDMSDLDELSAHINNRVINGIDPGTNSKSHESPLAELVRVWKANMQSLERIKVSLRNTTADTVKSMPATDGLQTSEQYFISPRGITHSGEMPSEILSLHATATDAADDDTTDNARDLHRNFPPPQLEKNKSFYARPTEESNASKPVLLHELIAQRKASTKSTPGSLTNMESASSAASLESSSPTRRATVIDAKTNLVPSPPTYYKRSLSFTSLSDRACSIAQREASTKSTPGSLRTNMESASSAASLESSSPTRRTTDIDAKTNLVPSPQTYLRSLSFNTSLNGGACSPAASPRLSTGLKTTTLVKPDGPNIPLGDNNDSENAAAISSPRTSRATYRRSLSLTSLNGGACSPAASPRLSTVGLMKMTLLVKPDGPNIPLAGNDDSENAAETAISSPRTLRALSQRERRKSNVSKVSLAPDADLPPVTESHSSPRPGRNDDNKPPPGIHKRTPVLSPDWQQQPQDVLKMTLDESPDGNMLCNDSESASVSSPRNLHVAHVLQREHHRKRSVSLKPVVRYGQAYYLTFEIPSDADLAPAVSYSSPRAGRNVDNEPKMYNRKPGLGQEWQQPQDLLAKAKVSPELVVKLPDLDLSKKASVMGISSTNAANCAGPQRNFSLSRTGSNDELIMSQARLCR